MNKFLKKVFLFILFPLIVVLPPVYILLSSNENISIESAIKYQKKNNASVLGFAYNQNTARLKYVRSMQVQPDILALGTSRIMQFSEDLFKEQYSFYNAGGAISEMEHFLPFMQKTKLRPQMLFIVLDQYFFNETWIKTQPKQTIGGSTVSFQTLIQSNFVTIWEDIFEGKIPFKYPYKANLGLLAKVSNDGFKFDGSYSYHRTMNEPEKSLDYMFVNTQTRLKQGISRFEYADTLCEKSLSELDILLAYCAENNIYVVGILPPYAPEIWHMMMVDCKDNYGYLSLLPGATSKIFNKWDFPLLDCSDGLSINSDDNEFVDGFHGSDKTYARIALQLSKIDDKVSEYLKSKDDLIKHIETLPDVNLNK